MPIKLYNFRFGPYPQRLNIYLAEKNAANVELILWDAPDTLAGIPPAAVKALTPAGSMPILEDDDGTVIGQSLAILAYLEDKTSGPDMMGVTPATRARTWQFIHLFDEALTFFGLWARHGSRLGQGVVRSSQAVAEICADRYFEQLRLIDRAMGETEFLAAESVTVADCVAMASLQYARDFYGVPIPPDCSKLARWYAAFAKRPSAVSPHYPEAKRTIALGLMAQTQIAIQKART